MTKILIKSILLFIVITIIQANGPERINDKVLPAGEELSISISTSCKVVEDIDKKNIVKDKLLYFPLKEGNLWEYESNLGKYTVEVEKGEKENEFLYISTLKLSKTKAYLEVKDNSVVCIKQDMKMFGTDTTYYEPPLVRYFIPVEPGKKFGWEGVKVVKGGKKIKAYIKGNISEEYFEIIVPAGKFKCLKMHAEYVCEDGSTQIFDQWLAPGVGVVKMDSCIKGAGEGILGVLQKVFKVNDLKIELKKYNVK